MHGGRASMSSLQRTKRPPSVSAFGWFGWSRARSRVSILSFTLAASIFARSACDADAGVDDAAEGVPSEEEDGALLSCAVEETEPIALPRPVPLPLVTGRPSDRAHADIASVLIESVTASTRISPERETPPEYKSKAFARAADAERELRAVDDIAADATRAAAARAELDTVRINSAVAAVSLKVRAERGVTKRLEADADGAKLVCAAAVGAAVVGGRDDGAARMSGKQKGVPAAAASATRMRIAARPLVPPHASDDTLTPPLHTLFKSPPHLLKIL